MNYRIYLTYAVELLFFLLVFLMGRVYGYYESLSLSPAFQIVPEVNPGVGIINIEEADCHFLKGDVQGRAVRIFYQDELIFSGENEPWQVRFDKY